MSRFWVILVILVPSVGFGQQIWPIDIWTGLYITVPNGATPCTVDFEDFIAFAQAFNSVPDDPNYTINADTNVDGIVNFPDFIAFAQVYGLSYVGEACRRGARHAIQTSGHVLNAGKPFENVWVDFVEADSGKVIESEKTDALGAFTFQALDQGLHPFVAKRFGYAFSPDTL